MIYPFTEAQILTDDLFVSYGGKTGTTTELQREAAYFTAEKWMSTEIGTLVIETRVTGTYYYPQYGSNINLDYTYVWNISEIRFIDTEGSNYYTITGTTNYHAALRNKERGIVDIFSILGYCRACGGYGWNYLPYQFEIAFNAGLPTGTYTSPSFLLGLTTAAEIALNEIQGWGGETFQGITEFRNQQYMEKRLIPVLTSFGASPKAQFIKSLVADIVRLNVVGL